MLGCIDVRCNGGLVVAPPSNHFSGKNYQWDDETTPIAICPDWLFDLLPMKGEKPKVKTKVQPLASGKTPADENTFVIQDSLTSRIEKYAKTIEPAIQGEGGRNKTFHVCCALVETFPGATNEQLISGLYVWNQSCSPPWDEYGNDSLEKKINEARAKVGIDEPDEPEEEEEEVSSPQNTSQNVVLIPDDEVKRPILDPIAYHGVIGDAVRLVEPYTEADPSAILFSLLTLTGCCVDQATIGVGREQHANLFTCIVGVSSRSRKGTSLYVANELLKNVFNQPQTLSGIGSGEGLVDAIKDEEDSAPRVAESQINNPATATFTIQSKGYDKRCLVEATEFGSILKVIKREGCTLSAIIRNAWDGDTLRSVTKGKKIVATTPHVSIIAHVTTKEVTKYFKSADESTNGFANRFLWCFADRCKNIPLAPACDAIPGIDVMRERLADAVLKARNIGSVTLSREAEEVYKSEYAKLTRKREGLYESVTTRAESQVIRLALVLAAIDGTSTIDARIIRAAISIWNYADASARYVFDCPDDESKLGNVVLQKIHNNPGKTKSAYRPNGHTSASELQNTLDCLLDFQSIHVIDDRYYPGAKTLSLALAPTRGKIRGKGNLQENTVNNVVNRDKEGTLPRCPTFLEKGQTDLLAKVEEENVKAATISELLDFKNTHQVSFVKNDDNFVILLSQEEVPKSIQLAVSENQQTVACFVSQKEPQEEEVVDDDDGNAFMRKLESMLVE